MIWAAFYYLKGSSVTQNAMKMTYRLVVLFLFITTLDTTAFTQCPGSLECEGSQVLCSIDQLNGFTCSTPYTPNTSFPTPDLCRGVGVPHNLNWWAFVGSGGPLNLTFNFDINNCEIGQGLQAGVFKGSCDGSFIWDCNASCNTSTFTLSGFTDPCAIYFVWVDGCNGDACDYTISVNGNGGSPMLPDPMPPLQVLGEPCAGGTVEVSFPGYPDGCLPYYEWTVDGVPTGGPRNESIELSIPCEDPLNTLEVCLTATIGNPSAGPGSICDQDMVCTTIVPTPPEVHIGECEVICFEDLPLIWHGIVVTSSCINPPCSIRTNISGSDCCVDSIKSFILLPPPMAGSLDTFICDPEIPFVAENSMTYTGEICDELIEFKSPVSHPACPTSTPLCDTAFYLSIGRLAYEKEWDISCAACAGEVTICPNIEFQTDCPAFEGQVRISLVWVDPENGDTLDVTEGDGCMSVTEPGEYCVYVQGTYRGHTCGLVIPECIVVDSSYFENPVISGNNFLCEETIGIYETDSDTAICEYLWTIPDTQGLILTMNPDSSSIEVDWTGHTGNEAEVCLQVTRDCSIRDTCWTVYFDTTETLANDTTIKCQDDTIVLQEPRPFDTRTWSTGDTTHSIQVEASGTYCVDGSGGDSSCQVSKCFVVIDQSLTIIDTTITNDHGDGDGSITLSVQSTDTITGIEWNNGDTTISIDSLDAGDYTVTITTELGCVYIFTFNVPLSTATSNTAGKLDLNIIPNPGATLRLYPPKALGDVESMEIISLSGKTVYFSSFPQLLFDASSLSDGLYLVKIEMKDGSTRILKWTKVD